MEFFFALGILSLLLWPAGAGEAQKADFASCRKGADIPSNVVRDEKLKSTKELWESVKDRLVRVRESCGELCDLDKKGKPGKFFDYIEKDIDCRYHFPTFFAKLTKSFRHTVFYLYFQSFV